MKRLATSTWFMLLAACLMGLAFAIAAHGQATYEFDANVPLDARNAVQAVSDEYALYLFDLHEQPGPNAILVLWEDLPGATAGEARCECWGHGENSVTLDSGFKWTPDLLYIVALHEFTHIILRTTRHHWGNTVDVLAPSTFWMPTRLSVSEQRRLAWLYDLPLRPIAPKLVWFWRP